MVLLGLTIVFVILVVIGLPIAFSMGVAALTGILIGGATPLVLIPHRTVNGVDSFVYLSIPLFILAGSLMDKGGIAERLITLARILVGRFKGGLGQTAVVGEMFFSGISGSTIADVSAMTSMLLPPMLRSNYKREHLLSIIAGSSAAGVFIPPCNMMIIMGAIADTSVLALFVAGLVPAVVLGLLIMGLIYYQAVVMDLPRDRKYKFKEVIVALKDLGLAAGLPIIIFGGILAGIATVTEVAALAVLYSLIVGVVIYREVQLREIPKILIDCATTTGMLMFIVGIASIFSYILATEQVPMMFANFIRATSESYLFVLGVICLIFVIFGSILEGVPAMLIFVPILLPIIRELHINMLQFSMIVIGAIALGLFVPPAGLGLMCICSVGGTDMERLAGYLFPYLTIIFMGLLILVGVPWFSTFLPDLLNLKY